MSGKVRAISKTLTTSFVSQLKPEDTVWVGAVELPVDSGTVAIIPIVSTVYYQAGSEYQVNTLLDAFHMDLVYFNYLSIGVTNSSPDTWFSTHHIITKYVELIP